MRRPAFPDPWPTSVKSLTNIGSGRNPTKKRNTAIAVLGRLGERTATAQILLLLERQLRAATGEQALLIAEVLGAISAAGGERLRDLVMERVLEQKNDESPEPARRAPSAEVPGMLGGGYAADLLSGCVPLQAWRSLDLAAAWAWISHAAILLAQTAPARKSNPMYPADEPEQDTESFRVGGRRFLTMLEILGACVEQHPLLIEGLALVFTTACDPEVTLTVHQLLKRTPDPETTRPSFVPHQPPAGPLPAMGSLAALGFPADKSPAKSPLQRTSDSARRIILSRILELTAHESWEIRSQAINELAGTPDLGGQEVVSARLAELTHHSDLQTRVLSTAALAKMKVSDPSPKFIEQLVRVEAVLSLESDQDKTIRSKAAGIMEKYHAPKSATQGGYPTYPLGPPVLGPVKEYRTTSPDLQIVTDLETPGQWTAALISLSYLGYAERVHPGYLPALCALAFGPGAVAPYKTDPLADSLESLIGNIVHAWPEAPESKDALQAALAALPSPRPELRQRAVGVLSCLPPGALNAWIDRIADSVGSSHACERTAALQTLRRYARSGWQAVRLEIIALLADPEVRVRCAAVELVLARNGLPRHDSMPEAVDDPETSAKVIVALCAFLDDARNSFEMHLQSLTSEPPLFPGSAKSAIKAIGSFGTAAYPSAAFTLLKLLFDEDPEIQFTAAKALCDMGPEPQARALESLLAVIESPVIAS
jgi:HEAT repeat protein